MLLLSLKKAPMMKYKENFYNSTAEHKGENMNFGMLHVKFGTISVLWEKLIFFSLAKFWKISTRNTYFKIENLEFDHYVPEAMN